MAWDDLTEGVMSACVDTFATPVLFTPMGLPSFETRGIFDDEARDVTLLDGSIVQSVTPRLGMLRSALNGRKAKNGDRVVVQGTEYRVIEWRPDGQAGCSLILEKVKS